MEFDGNVACTNPVSTSAVTKQSQNFINYKKAFVGFTAGSRSHSPHFSPDRITRHASPSRLELAQREVSIVPRIPQPYRTSFSAVTAPLRIPKDTSSELNLQSISSAINLLGVNRRTTSPGRIKPVTCRPGPEPLQYSSSADILYTSNEITELRRDESLDILQNSNPVCDIKSTMPLHVPESCHHDERHFCNNSETLIPFDIINATEDITDATIVDDGKLFAKQNTSETCISLNFAAEEVKSTRQAENWPLFGKFKSFRSDRRPIMGRSHGVSPNSGIKPNDSKISNSGITSVSNEVRGRSKTMPSQAVISENSINASRNPKSLSMSITSFFKKMSPKSLRRFGGMVAKSNQNSQEATTSSDSLVEFSELGSGNTSLSKGCTSGDCFASDTSGLSDNSHFRNSVESGRSSRSLKKSPRLPSVKRMFAGRNRQRDAEKHAEKNDVEGIKPPSENVASGQLLTPEMNLMMKSIEDGSARVSQKSVYQAFKEKRSPVRASESALGMKPQSLQTVEFPDNLLQPNLSNANGSNLNSGLLSSVDGVQNDIQPVSSCPNVGSGPCISPAVRQVLEPSGRRQDPPRTLNVQSVQMIGKQLFHFPSMSVESIGQCSLDVADAGKFAGFIILEHLICIYDVCYCCAYDSSLNE